MIERFRHKSVRPGVFYAGLIGIVVVRLLFAYSQRIFLMTEGSSLDDMLMVRAAMSIAEGNWLGEYGAYTISKNMGFAVWVWLMHTLRIPLLLGNCALWIGACAFATRAVRPLLPGNLARVVVFGFFAFSPYSFFQYTMRAYRDGIFPALCLFLFAGAVGLGLRLHQTRARGSVLMALGAGLGLAGGWLIHEDGVVLLIFAVLALGFVAGFALLHPAGRKRVWKILCCILPVAVLGGGILGFAAMNKARYGVFLVNDMTGGSFASAYGTMTGVSRAASGYTGKTPVSNEALREMMEHSPALAELEEELLVKESVLKGFGDVETGEYGGSFYYALRLAASRAGLAPDGATAQEYWARVNAELNAAIEAGRLATVGGANSVVPRFHRSLLLPTAQETLVGGLTVLLFEDEGPRPQESQGEPEAVEATSAWLYSRVQEGYHEGTDEPYLNLLQRIVFGLCDLLTLVYTVLIWPLAVLAVVRTWRLLWAGFAGVVKKRRVELGFLQGILALGLACSFVLRLVVAAYMEVAAFGIGTYTMYLSGGVPALLLFCVVALCLPQPEKKARRLRLTELRLGKKDLRVWGMIAIGVGLVALKLLMASAQDVFLAINESPLDDTLMIESAMSITGGNWLGEYGWKTLSKGSFFALWLAGLHAAGIPYLFGGQLLWCLASLAGAWAMGPVLRRRWQCLTLFGVLLFNPASTANPAPFGFVTRVYRDNIFPALCLLCVAGMVGYALRYRRKLGHAVPWLVVAGLGLAAAWLAREDGWWLLPLVVGAVIVTAVTVLRSDAKKKRLRLAALALPFAILGASLAGWAGMNYAYYGRFILSDFSRGEFAQAYGALTRVEHEDWDPKVAVPLDVREKLYTHSEQFAELEQYLESGFYLGRYAGEDYSSGSFYWALREAAAEAGWYDTPQKAQEMWEQLADEVNALCDSGVLAAGPRRASVNPPIKAAYIWPTVQEAFGSLVYVATFQGTDARSLLSLDDRELNAPVEAYLKEKALVAAVAGTDQPYYSPLQSLAFVGFGRLQGVYAICVPVLALLALAAQVVGAVRYIGRLRKRKRNGWEALVWWVGLGLLFCVVLRCFMIAYVSVSSFNIGTYIMYLASVHPILLLWAFGGTAMLMRLWQRAGRKGK